MSTLQLADLPLGQQGRIIRLQITGPRKRRLMDMGMVVGEVVQMEKIAPLGDPMDVIVKDYHLSLRRSEAEGILVEVVS
jgi:ferrous iron transport protein A